MTMFLAIYGAIVSTVCLIGLFIMRGDLTSVARAARNNTR